MHNPSADHAADRVRSTATRRLCAGMYLDRSLRDTVIRYVHNDSRHRVAPSYGFDLVPVVAHAKRAWALETAHQSGVLVVLVTGLVTDFEAGLLALCVIAAPPLLLRVARHGLTVLRLKSRSIGRHVLGKTDAAGEEANRRQVARRFTLSLLGCIVVAAGPWLPAGLNRYQVTAAVPGALTIVVLVVFLTSAAAAVRQWAINRLHRAGKLRPAKLTRRLKTIDTQQSGTLVVYRRNTSGPREQTPFVGSGTQVFRLRQQTIQLIDDPEQADQLPREQPRFSTYELVEFLRKKIAELGDSGADGGLPGLYVRDRLFVSSENALAAVSFLNEEPTPREIEQIVAEPYGHVHHYLEIGVPDTGEVVVTVFVRPTVRAGALNLDIALGVLTRPPSSYGIVDALGEQGIGAVIRAAGRAAWDLPGSVRRTWLLARIPALAVGAVLARTDRTLVLKRKSTIGTRLSVRERAEVLAFRSDISFDQAEINAHKNLILQPILNAVKEFLKSKGIDISAFAGQVTNIINASVFNTGVFEANGTAIGENSTVNNTEKPDKAPGDES